MTPNPPEGKRGPAAAIDVPALAPVGTTLPLPGLEPPIGASPPIASSSSSSSSSGATTAELGRTGGPPPRSHKRKPGNPPGPPRRATRKRYAHREPPSSSSSSSSSAPPLDATGPAPAPVDPGPSAAEVDALARALGVAFSVACALVAARRGDHWRLQPAESDALGTAWAIAFAPHLGAMAQHVPWVTALLATVGVVLPRLEADAAAVAALELSNGRRPAVPTVDPPVSTAAAALEALRRSGVEPRP